MKISVCQKNIAELEENLTILCKKLKALSKLLGDRTTAEKNRLSTATYQEALAILMQTKYTAAEINTLSHTLDANLALLYFILEIETKNKHHQSVLKNLLSIAGKNHESSKRRQQ